jgi:uncharacterized protein (DUF362 family)
VELPDLFFEGIDFSISCPVPKVHCMTGLSLALKNQWGCLPDLMRLRYHHVFNELIGPINKMLNFKYAFLDGKYGLDLNGPIEGKPVETDWYAASNSLGAFDLTVSGLMGIDWRKIGHLKASEKYGLIPKPEEISIRGDVRQHQRKFKLKRNVWNYPALLAFQSRSLTNFVYLSRYSKLIHDLMYLIRRRPITD